MAVNVAAVAPAPTATEAGTVNALPLLSERLTTAPPLGAGKERATVQEEADPDVKLVGVH